MKFPPLLAELHALDYDTDEDDGLYFEPLSAFLPKKETKRWFRAWTGNPEADGSSLKVFAEDGAGGMTAFWQVLPDLPLLMQPVVFLGSEGERGVAARDFDDYLWLLAQGHAAAEAVSYPDDTRKRVKAFKRFAKQHAPSRKRPVSRIVAEAEAAFPTFRAWVNAQCADGDSTDAALAVCWRAVDEAVVDGVPQLIGSLRHEEWPAAMRLLHRLDEPAAASLCALKDENDLSPAAVAQALAALLPWLAQVHPSGERVLLERMIAVLAYAQSRSCRLRIQPGGQDGGAGSAV
ncbi:hypothetical protein [Leeia aquatica]|uniref:hypothetical protein n=1 Tax=Leeia aquatica TaxID=2725557 RepID=UPI001980CB3F|nr:hypothetical protein [Leeia aquatica]